MPSKKTKYKDKDYLFERRNVLRDKLARAHLAAETFGEKSVRYVLLTIAGWALSVVAFSWILRQFINQMRGSTYTMLVFGGPGGAFLLGWALFFFIRKIRMTRLNSELTRIQMALCSLDDSEADAEMWERERARTRRMQRL
ncbi:MAG: hypothetical protein FWF10_05525 [Clostridiales bacterium]|nr:hypothetical protein [Clostridiales bacterium]